MIELAQLSRHFSRSIAVNNLSFCAVPGEVLGLLGPNGAGKSTTIRMLTGFLAPTFGRARVFNFDVQRQARQAQRLIGYLPERTPYYADMKVQGFLSFIADVRGYHGAQKRQRVSQVLEQFELGEVAGQAIETLSKGFKRRVGLAQAVLHDPRVLILDEPTDGLDPTQKHRVREQIRALARDKIVLLSTHILEEVTALCSRVLVLDKGQLLADGTLDELHSRSRYHQAVTLFASHPLDPFALALVPGVHAVEAGPEVNSLRVLARSGEVIFPQVNELVTGKGWRVMRQEVERGSLDEVFRTLIQGNRQ